MKIEAAFYAVEIADTGSFSQAARNLYLSQPNLSYAVRQLEQELGVKLFDRHSGGASVTPEGQEIIERFRIIRREYEEINEYAGMLHPARKSLWIGSMSSSRGAFRSALSLAQDCSFKIRRCGGGIPSARER